ncbi:MAG: hypothetical protein ACYC7D_14820 [Nitrososphaerales archaeon]
MPKLTAAEPASYVATGFAVSDLLSKDFMAELRKEFPNAGAAAILII